MQANHAEVEQIIQKVIKEIETHLKENGVKWLRLADFLKDLEQSCVDGRDDHCVIGIPGGDMGALVLKIVVAEQILKQNPNTNENQFDKQAIKEIFARYIARFGKFYFHSDEHAVEHLGQVLLDKHGNKEVDLFAGLDLNNVEAVEQLIRKPQNDQQKQALLEELVKPENVGCGHIKLMLQNPEQYGIRVEIVEALIEDFFEEMWEFGEDAQEDFVVLPGEHAEKLVLVVNVGDQELALDSLVPAVRPLNPDTKQDDAEDEFFIYHPQVVAAILRLVIDVMVQEEEEVIPGINQDNVEIFIEEVQKLQQRQLTATLGHLAHDKDVYQTTVTLDSAGETVIFDTKKVSE